MHEDGFEIAHLCEALGIHRNGFYRWLNASENIYQQQDTRRTPMLLDQRFCTVGIGGFSFKYPLKAQ